jgi:short-subunit dehydrogenase
MSEMSANRESEPARLNHSYPYIDPGQFKNSLRGSNVLVTGAGRGIGRAIALAFSDAGANIVCVARTISELDALSATIVSRNSSRVMVIAVDVAAPGAAEKIYTEVTRTFGVLDVLVNNAGIDKINTVEHEEDFESWWRVIEVNLKGPASLIHKFLPGMISRGRGNIISIGSRNAVVNMPFLTAYSASKKALLRFHQCLDLEIAETGVYNYYVQPSDVATTMTHGEGVIDMNTAKRVPKLRQMLENSIGRSATSPELVANTCVMLVANEKAKVLRGLYIDVQRELGKIIEDAVSRSEYRASLRPSCTLKVGLQ